MDKEFASKLHRSIIVFSMVGILAIGLIVAVVSILPFSKYLKNREERHLLLAVHSKRIVVDEFLTRIKEEAHLVTGPHEISDEFKNFKNDKITEGFITLKKTEFEKTMSISPDIEGISRYSKKGELIVQSGLPIPPKFYGVSENNGKAALIAPVFINNQPHVIVRRNFFNGDSLAGTDMILFNTKSLEEIVTNYRGLGKTGETILGVTGRDSIRLFYDLRNKKGVRKISQKTLIGKTFVKSSSHENGVVIDEQNKEIIAFYALPTGDWSFQSVPSPNWDIAVRMSSKELYAPINRQIIIISVIVLILVIGGVLGMLKLLRPLSGKLLIHSDELAHEVREKTLALGKELQERKKAQKELEKAHAELEKRVEERTAELSESNKKLRDFAHIVSHDLKAPLRSIASVSEWLIEDYTDKLDEEGKESLQLLKSKSKKMGDMIEGILQHSKRANANIPKDEIDLNVLVKEVIEHLSIPENIDFKIDNELPVISADHIPMFQVFQNLIDNAIKYMDKPLGKISIGCSREGDFWKLYVKDNGPGIAEDDFAKVFRLFETLPGSEKKGTGVGLALVHEIISEYGGKIWVESELGEGSIFYFTVPGS